MGGGKNLDQRQKDLPGLAYYVVEVASKDELLSIFQRAQALAQDAKWLTSSSFFFKDTDGIVTQVRVG